VVKRGDAGRSLCPSQAPVEPVEPKWAGPLGAKPVERTHDQAWAIEAPVIQRSRQRGFPFACSDRPGSIVQRRWDSGNERSRKQRSGTTPGNSERPRAISGSLDRIRTLEMGQPSREATLGNSEAGTKPRPRSSGLAWGQTASAPGRTRWFLFFSACPSIGSGLDQPVRGNQLLRADKNNQHQLLTNQTSDQQILREEKSADQSINNTRQFDSFRSDLSTMHNPI
jgi:hypothetical protein